MQRNGANALSDFELLEALIGTGVPGADVGQIARKVQKLLQNDVSGAFTLEGLTAIKGVSTATASKLLASLELARRHLVRSVAPLRATPEVLAHISDIRTRRQEYCLCLSLDGGHRLITKRTVTVGILDAVLVHPREIFADAIADRAATVIIAHNHPSGIASPTQKDITLTQQLRAAGQLLGIPLHDHLIVTKVDYYSFREHHWL